MGRILALWEDTRSSLRFVPALMALGAIVLAIAFIEVDSHVSYGALITWPVLIGSSAEGARNVLSAIAGSMITVAGVTFSITIVALSLASNQFTPRILRNFMRDRTNQVVLGVFTSVFIYCLVVLRAIRGGEEAFVPSLSVLFAIALSLASIGFLIYFIHHVATSIQASTIISSVAKETIDTIIFLFPDELGEGEEEDKKEEELKDQLWEPIPSISTGYIQRVAPDALLGFAEENGVIVKMERGIGEFIIEGSPLASLALCDGLKADAAHALNDLYAVNSYRTIREDTGFGIRQIVDIALKALSPGINDTTTAVICIDYLGSILYCLARRSIPPRNRYSDGELRVIARGPTFESLVDESLHEIRQNAKGNVAVILRLLSLIETVADQTRSASRRRVLWRHVSLISECAEQNVQAECDRFTIAKRVASISRQISPDALQKSETVM